MERATEHQHPIRKACMPTYHVTGQSHDGASTLLSDFCTRGTEVRQYSRTVGIHTVMEDPLLVVIVIKGRSHTVGDADLFLSSSDRPYPRTSYRSSAMSRTVVSWFKGLALNVEWSACNLPCVAQQIVSSYPRTSYEATDRSNR